MATHVERLVLYKLREATTEGEGIEHLCGRIYEASCKRSRLIYLSSSLQWKKTTDETRIKNDEKNEHFENFIETPVSIVAMNELSDESHKRKPITLTRYGSKLLYSN